MDAMAEALAQAEGEQDMEKKIEQALACPCLGDLKEGPCGPVFVHAFGCFIRSEHEDKGMDCLPEFAAFQACLQKHPEHVARIMEDSAEVATDEQAGAEEAAASGGGSSGNAAVAASPSEAAQQTPAQQ
ncbi:hypothetical protein ABPG77_008421 [Micractinium sp. CCAP 211/92]